MGDKLFISEGYPAPAALPEMPTAAMDRYVSPDEYEEHFDALHTQLIDFTRGGVFEKRLSYRDVRILDCYKKYLFDYLFNTVMKRIAFKRFAERHPDTVFYLDSTPRGETLPRLHEAVLASDRFYRRVRLLREEPGPPLVRNAQSAFHAIKTCFWPRHLAHGKPAKLKVLFAAGFDKTKAILENFDPQTAGFYSTQKTPRLFLDCLRRGLLFEQHDCSHLKKAHPAQAAFLESVRREKLFAGFTYRSHPLQAAGDWKIGRLFYQHLNELLFSIDEAYRFFSRARRLKSVYLEEDIFPLRNALCQVAKACGKKTFVEAHGILAEKSGYTPLTADHLFSWGGAHTVKLQRWGLSSSQILVTGHGRYVPYLRLSEGRAKQHLRDTLRLPAKQPVVLLAFHPLFEERYFFDDRVDKTIRRALECLGTVSGCTFLLKTHPGDKNQTLFRRWCVAGADRHLLTRMDPLLLARGCDALIAFQTTFAVDGYAMNKPVLCLRGDLPDPYAEYTDHHAFRVCLDPAALARALSELLNDTAAGRAAEPGREACLHFGHEPAHRLIANHLLHPEKLGQGALLAAPQPETSRHA